jgi:hypothetical protein
VGKLKMPMPDFGLLSIVFHVMKYYFSGERKERNTKLIGKGGK